ncbi:MAG: type II toxin-antitoxin system Phd/YefM family antitoxin [Allosphingosinicella sp.]
MKRGTAMTVSSTDFQNAAGRYFDQAASEPVVITKYRRPARVLIAFEEYERLQALAKARPTRKAFRSAELPEDVAAALATADYGHIDRNLDKLME